MNLERVIPFGHHLLQKRVKKGDIVIDCTIGNGHDTLFLAELVGPNGHVFGFDIQEKALKKTTARLKEHELLERVTLFQQGHENILSSIPSQHYGQITGAIFNLGYLPGGDKTIVTKPQTTISAIKHLLQIMATGGIIVLIVYHGHPEGAVERDELLEFCMNLDQNHCHVLKYQFINQKNSPPFLIAIEKRENAQQSSFTTFQ